MLVIKTNHCKSSPCSFNKSRRSGCRLQTNPTDLGCETASKCCYHPHSPSPFILITQPINWYTFLRPTKGGGLSQPGHRSKGVQPVPKAVYRSGCRDKHNCPGWDSNLGPLTPQSGMLPLDHCSLLNAQDKNTWTYPRLQSYWFQPDDCGPTQHKISHLGDVLPRQSLVFLLSTEKLNQTQQVNTTSKWIRKKV